MALRSLLSLLRPGPPEGPTVLSILPPAEEVARAVEMLLAGAAGRPGPEAAVPRTKPEKVEAGMRQNRVVRVEYTRARDGGTEEYFLKPYEVKPHPASGRTVLYATDSKHGDGQIHSFLWSRLRDVMMTDNRFAPVWPTRPETVP